MSMERLNVTILPAGRFGTALAVPLSENANVTLCIRSSEDNRIFQETRENQKYFPGIKLPDNIHSTDNLEEGLNKADVVILVPPSWKFREVYTSYMSFIPRKCLRVCGSKGMEEDTEMMMSQVMRDVDPSVDGSSYAVISGPNFAHEIVRGLPAATVIASENDAVTKKLQRLFRTNYLVPYMTDDVIGVQLGGAFKNPMAMAVGICDGMHMGNNAAAALMNRGLKEMTRLAVLLGADERTLMGLAGESDLSLSCRPGGGGRNYDAGIAIGRGEDPKLLFQSEQTIEALHTIKPAISLAHKNNVEVPILEGLHEIIYGGLQLSEVVSMLIERDHSYEDPQPIIHRKLRLPLRVLNRLFHLWGR